jgi:hypothetical protein
MFAVRAIFFLSLCACAHADDKKPDAPKTFEMKFKAAKWDDVFAWYAKETGLAFVAGKDNALPKGALTLRTDAMKKFTVGEMTDLLNEALVQQKWLLIRRTQSFVVVPADEKIDATLVPRVALSELPDRGRTELVQVVLRPPAEILDSLDEVKRLLTPFGSITRFKDTFIITDTVGNIGRIQKTIEL